MDDSDARTLRALDYLAAWGCAEGPERGDFPTFADWYRAWADYIQARTMAGHHWRRLEREALEPPEPERQEAERPPPAGRPREGGPVGSLSDDAVRAIRQRHAAGEARASIADAFNISPMTVSRVAHRQRYGHVTD